MGLRLISPTPPIRVERSMLYLLIGIPSILIVLSAWLAHGRFPKWLTGITIVSALLGGLALSNSHIGAVTITRASIGIVVLAWVVGGASWYVGRAYPRVGLKPLLHTGALIMLSIIITEVVHDPSSRREQPGREAALERQIDAVIQRLAASPDLLRADPSKDPNANALRRDLQIEIRDIAALNDLDDLELERGPIWPIVLAGPAFLYLWWLAALMFDLAFVWHLYIRYEGARTYIDDRLELAREEALRLA